METVKREMYAHLPKGIQEQFEPAVGRKLINFTDRFAEGGPVVLVSAEIISEEQKRKNRERIYEVCADIMNEMAEAEAQKNRL